MKDALNRRIMKDALKLRGAIEMLSRAMVHVGRGHLVDEWGDGRDPNPSIEKTSNILRKAIWRVEAEFRKVDGRP